MGYLFRFPAAVSPWVTGEPCFWPADPSPRSNHHEHDRDRDSDPVGRPPWDAEEGDEQKPADDRQMLELGRELARLLTLRTRPLRAAVPRGRFPAGTRQ